jgi:hypothetical protein
MVRHPRQLHGSRRYDDDREKQVELPDELRAMRILIRTLLG